MIQVYQGQGSQGHSVILCLLWEYQGADLQGGEHGGTWGNMGTFRTRHGKHGDVKIYQNMSKLHMPNCQTAFSRMFL